MTRPDITLTVRNGEFSFVPHTGEADRFLAGIFADIGDRNLTSDDCEAVLAWATYKGFVVSGSYRSR